MNALKVVIIIHNIHMNIMGNAMKIVQMILYMMKTIIKRINANVNQKNALYVQMYL